MFRGVFFIFILMFLLPVQAVVVKHNKYVDTDYVAQLSFLGVQYRNSVKMVTLSKKKNEYLVSLYQKILSKNERFMKKTMEPSFFIVKDDNPFYFSLPNNYYFFSQGLIQKYFRNEMTLASCLAYMMLQAHNDAFMKRIVVPTGYISTDQLISLIKLPLNLKADLNKAVFWALQAAGLDGSYYLQWIQLQNRNTLDFSRQIGDPQFITKEEFLFKQFVAKENISSFTLKSLEGNSTKGFYRFIRGI